jgi:hypothetical protein
VDTITAIQTDFQKSLPINKIAQEDLPSELKRVEALQKAFGNLPVETSGTDEGGLLKSHIQLRINLIKGAITRLNLRKRIDGDNKRNGDR